MGAVGKRRSRDGPGYAVWGLYLVDLLFVVLGHVRKTNDVVFCWFVIIDAQSCLHPHPLRCPMQHRSVYENLSIARL